MNYHCEAIAQQVLKMVSQKGPVQAEVFILDSQEMTIEVAKQQVENMKLAQERGLGLRVLVNQRMGYAYSSDLSREALNKVVEKAIHNARETEADPNWELPVPAAYSQLDTYDEETFQIPVEDKIELAQKIEEAARGYDPRVTLTEKVVYQETGYRIYIYNSLGLAGHFKGSYCGGYAVVVSQENNDSQTGFGLQYELKYAKLNPWKIGREAGEKAVRMLGAKIIPSARMTVVLDPYTVTSFLGVLQMAFSAEAVLKGRSFLKGEEGKRVASPLLTIIDDGNMKDRLGSSPFDGEGVPTRKTLLVKDGSLENYLQNTYTAKKFGTSSTGNSVRSSYKGTPEVGITNFYIREGTTSREDIFNSVDKGLYITDVLGMHTANPVSGDFSLGASGLLIENGELTVPVKGIAVAGNLKEMLLEVDAVGNDLTFFIGKGAPTLRIGGMSISGK